MKAKDEYLSGVRTQYVLSGSGPSYSTPGTLYHRDKVTRGPLVRGNRSAPNSWSYDTLESSWPVVSGTEYIYYPLSQEALGITYGVVRHTGPRENMGSFGSVPDAPPWGSDLRPAWLYNSALERLYEKLRGNLDLSIALAEAGTTSRMLKSYTAWDRFVESLPRVRRKSDLYYFFPKLIGNSWLQWTYGWKPLISDIYNVADEAVRKVQTSTIVRSSATQRYDNTHARNFPISGFDKGRYVRRGGQSVRFKCRFAIPEKDFSVERWTSLNPVSIAWELLPYSFVVDWFVDIGSTLRTLESSILYRTYFQSGYWSWLSWYDTTVTFPRYYRWANQFEAHAFIWDRPPVAWERYRSFRRYVLTSSPRPRTPTFHVDLSWRRLLSSAALLAQRMGR